MTLTNTQAEVAQAMAKTIQTQRPKAQVPETMANLKQGQIGELLLSMKDRIAQALPKHLSPERIIQMAATTISRNPKIAGCTTSSLCGAVMQASILGFSPVEALGYCYFVPYGKEVQFQIGYKGLIELARRSGKIKSVYAEVVYEGDEFEYALGLEPTLRHKPTLQGRGELLLSYAVCHFTEGGYNFVVLTREEIEKLRQRSPMQRATPSGAWATDYEAMAKAKALKQLSKYLPLNIDQVESIATDGAIIKAEDFEGGRLNIEAVSYDAPNLDAQQVDTTTGEVLEADSNSTPDQLPFE